MRVTCGAGGKCPRANLMRVDYNLDSLRRNGYTEALVT